MRILALEPYATPSHQLFLEGLAAHSRHRIEIAGLPGRYWKWRMGTASMHFARTIAADGPFDLLFASDYLALAELLALLPRDAPRPPSVVYFHENQLTYPLQEGETRDVQFAIKHVHAILAAEHTLFNSNYHRRAFLTAAEELLARAPDVDLSPEIERLASTSGVLPVGVDVPAREPRPANDPPVILWPHRWEYDKDPDAFLTALVELEARDVPFRLRLLGQRFRKTPPALDELERRFADRLEASDFLSRNAYLEALAASDVVVSTAKHEFFGLATLEAIRSGALPVLPDDLAYPELLPEELRRAPYLVKRDASFADALEVALASSREVTDERRALVVSTERFTWPELAPRFDAVFDEAAN